MAFLQKMKIVVKRNMFLPTVRWVSREEAEYWLQMSKKQDVFPSKASKISKLEHLDEYGPCLPPSVFKTGQLKNNFTNIGSDGIEQVYVEDKIKNTSSEIEHHSEQIADVEHLPSDILIKSVGYREIFTENNLIVPLLNRSRSIPSVEHLLHSNEIYKIGHIRNPSIPSVSKVLAATMSEESKDALARWEKEKIAMLGLTGFKQLKADTFARGHNLHNMLETYMETKQLPKASDIPDSVSKRHLVSISQTVRQFDKPLLLESAVIHPDLNYCGIVDCVAMVGDTLALVDWKTSEKVKNNASALYDNPLQVAAYIGAINRDQRYSSMGNITNGVVVVVYNSGYPAMVHMFNTEQMEMYWEQWCHRLQMFHNMN